MDEDEWIVRLPIVDFTGDGDCSAARALKIGIDVNSTSPRTEGRITIAP